MVRHPDPRRLQVELSRARGAEEERSGEDAERAPPSEDDDRERDEVSYGRVPAGAVVVAGSLPSASGKCSLYCAVIVKRVDAQTRSKVSLNELLRD